MDRQSSEQAHGDGVTLAQPNQSDSSARQFKFVGSMLCLDLVNTEKMVDGRRADLLQTADDLKRWLCEARLAAPSDALWQTEAEGRKALADMKSLRKALRGMASGMAAGEPLRAETVTAINAALKRKSTVLQLRQVEDSWKVGREDTGRHSIEHIGAAIAESAADLIANHNWSHVRQCGSDRCILFFLDTTKNHARRWCSMGVCGNRVKANAHYHRSKA